MRSLSRKKWCGTQADGMYDMKIFKLPSTSVFVIINPILGQWSVKAGSLIGPVLAAGTFGPGRHPAEL